MQLEYIMLTETRYRPRFVFYKNDTVIGSSLAFYGEYQQLELDFLTKIINRNTTVWDIGGNIGYHATAFASHAGMVHSFEANPEHFKLLKMNLQGDRHARHYNTALGDYDGSIRVEAFDPAQSSNYGAVRVGSEQGVEVPMSKIDTLAKEIASPDFIKIDVEGHELSVLKGGCETISRRRPVIYFEAQETKDLPEIYTMLDDLDYEMTWIVVRNFNPDNFKKNQQNIFSNSAIFSILAYPVGLLTNCPLPVLGPNDNWQRFCDNA